MNLGEETKDRSQMEHSLSQNIYPDSDELAEAIWNALFGLGPIPEQLAYSQALKRLTDDKMFPPDIAKEQHALNRLMRKAFDTAIHYQFIDVPRDGFLRAVLKTSEDYEFEDWRRCIINSMGDTPMEREQVIRAAVEWARENLGLRLPRFTKGGKIWLQLDSVLNDIIRTKEIKQTVFYGVERLQLVS